MNARNNRCATHCRQGQTAEVLTYQGKCFVIFGVVLCVVGVALVVVAAVVARTYVIGPTVVVFVWGVMLLFLGWRRFQLAKHLQNGNTAQIATIPQSNILYQANHQPMTTAYGQSQQPNAAFAGITPYPAGYGQPQTQGFAGVPPYPVQPATAPSADYSSALPPYPSDGKFQGFAPPTYADAMEKKN